MIREIVSIFQYGKVDIVKSSLMDLVSQVSFDKIRANETFRDVRVWAIKSSVTGEHRLSFLEPSKPISGNYWVKEYQIPYTNHYKVALEVCMNAFTVHVLRCSYSLSLQGLSLKLGDMYRAQQGGYQFTTDLYNPMNPLNGKSITPRYAYLITPKENGANLNTLQIIPNDSVMVIPRPSLELVGWAKK